MKYQKDHERWKELQKKLDKIEKVPFVHPREIWWCALGVNIGAEIDGKNENFERPVLILKVYSRETCLILPVTTKLKRDQFHYETMILVPKIWVKISQSRTISQKRLLRKVDILSEDEFEIIKIKFRDSI